jgi:hypothetical protein
MIDWLPFADSLELSTRISKRTIMGSIVLLDLMGGVALSTVNNPAKARLAVEARRTGSLSPARRRTAAVDRSM